RNLAQSVGNLVRDHPNLFVVLAEDIDLHIRAAAGQNLSDKVGRSDLNSRTGRAAELLLQHGYRILRRTLSIIFQVDRSRALIADLRCGGATKREGCAGSRKNGFDVLILEDRLLDGLHRRVSLLVRRSHRMLDVNTEVATI